MKNIFSKDLISQIVIFTIIIISFAGRYYIEYSTRFISSDAIQFIEIGQNFYSQGKFESDYGVVPSWAQSPVFPIIVGFFSLFLPGYWAGILTTEIIFILSLLVFGLLVRDIFGKKFILPAIAFFAILPIHAYVNNRILSESLFLFFNLFIFRILYLRLDQKIKNKIKPIFLLAIASFLMYLTRVEGIFFIILLLFIIYKLFDLKKSVVYLVIISSFLSLYGLFSYSQYGVFNPFPKITFNKRLAVAVQDYTKMFPAKVSIEKIQAIAWYGYDPRIKDLYSNRIMENSYYTTLKKETASNNQSFPLSAIVKNIREMIRTLISSLAFPAVLSILALIGLYFSFIKNRKILGLIIIWLLPGFYFLISHVEYRFLYFFVPYAVIFAFFSIEKFFSKSSKINLKLVSIILVLAVFCGYYLFDFYQTQKSDSRYYHVSFSLEKEIPDNQKVTVKIPHIAFWSALNFTKLPVAHSEKQLHEYLVKNGTQFLLLGDEVYTTNESYQKLYETEISEYFIFKTKIKNDDKVFKLFIAKS